MRALAVFLLLEYTSGSLAAEISPKTGLLSHVAAVVVRKRTAAAREWWSISVHAVDNQGRRFAILVTYFRFALGRSDELDTAEVSVLNEATSRFATLNVQAVLYSRVLNRIRPSFRSTTGLLAHKPSMAQASS